MDRFQQSDVTIWGIVALACGALAVMSVNIGGLIPTSLGTALHATRIEGGSLNVLRSQIAEVRNESARLRRENQLLTTRLNLADQTNGTVSQRVGALEASVPLLLEALPADANIDRDAITASIGQSPGAVNDVEGGSLEVSQQPMPGTNTLELLTGQAMPELPATVADLDTEIANLVQTEYAVALGDPLAGGSASRTWDEINELIGPLLLGLEPRVGNENAGADRLIAGPIRSYAQAEQLCLHVARVGMACTPTPYKGTELFE
jgi:hypothetical protein